MGPGLRRGCDYGLGPGLAWSAPEVLLLRLGALADRRAGVGKIVVELGEGDTGVFVLVGAGERHAELQKIVGRLGALWPALVALGKGGGGVEKAVAGEVGLAEPVLRVARHRVL